MRDAADLGEHDRDALLERGRNALTVDRIDYLELVDAESLEPIEEVRGPTRALVAAFVGTTRLIDNVHVGPSWS